MIRIAGIALFLSVASTGMAYTFDSNVPKEIQQQITQDLESMKQIASQTATAAAGRSTPLHQKIFGAVDGPGYVQFFESRVKGVGMNSCGGGNAVACVIPFFDSTKIWLTKNYTQFSHPTIAKMMVVFHEARHTERQNGNWGHATCPTPFLDADGAEMKSIWTGASLAGEPACDVTPLGSYGSSTILLKNVQKFCTTCSEKMRMDAGIYSDDQLKRVTDPKAKADMIQDFASADL